MSRSAFSDNPPQIAEPMESADPSDLFFPAV